MNMTYKINNLKKSGNGPGGKFNGPKIKLLISEDKLEELDNVLPAEASPFITYLRSTLFASLSSTLCKTFFLYNA